MGGIVSWVPGGSGAKKNPHAHASTLGCRVPTCGRSLSANPLLMWSSFSQAALQRHVTKILERGQKWNGVPIFPCKIWHGQENNGSGIAASSRTMIEGVHGLDRQAGGVQMGVVRQENGRTQSPMSVLRAMNG